MGLQLFHKILCRPIVNEAFAARWGLCADHFIANVPMNAPAVKIGHYLMTF